MKKLLFALSLLVASSSTLAQTTTQIPQVGASMIDVDIPVTAKLPDGTTTTTTYTIPGGAIWNWVYQELQHSQNAATFLYMRQYAQPVCLIGVGADNFGKFDWSTNKLRADGAIYSVNSVGVPYRNGVRIGSVSVAQKLCLYGTDIFLKGSTDGRWAVWKDGAWYVLPTNSIDTSVFN